MKISQMVFKLLSGQNFVIDRRWTDYGKNVSAHQHANCCYTSNFSIFNTGRDPSLSYTQCPGYVKLV